MLETPPFEMIHSPRRRRVAIRVSAGKVQLLTPPFFPDHEAHAFLAKNLAWVHKKLHEQKSTPHYSPKSYLDGELFPYLGENYVLNIACSKTPSVMLRQPQLFVFIRETTDAKKRTRHIHQQLRAWYWAQAKEVLEKKSQDYAQRLAVQFKSITIKEFRARWGSCSIKGAIQYNWRIMLAPLAVVDYLVIHELSHLRHHNHSSKFWQQVESIMPDYKRARKWLKAQGHLLRMD